MRADEARAIGTVAGRALAGTAALARDLEDAVFARATGATPGGHVVAAAHRAISGPIHGLLRHALGGLGAAVGHGVAAVRPEAAPSIAETRAGALALGALGGLCGDRVQDGGGALAIPMELRGDHGRIAPDAASLSAAHPDATGRIAVFVHGLCETEAAWRLFAPPAGPADYGARLRTDLAYTPLYVRYDSGGRISENGRRLADLLDAVVGAWPVPVAEVALIGHSMGGLVIRSAAYYGDERGDPWVPALRHVFCLASPHHGAPLAKAAHAAAWALAKVPETRGLARVLDLRSAGIRDLRHGYLLDEDWKDRDPAAWAGADPRDVPFVETATYHALSAGIARSDRHPLGHLAGDLLVRRGSASGRSPRGRRVPFDIGTAHHARGLNHFDVLNDPGVYRHIRACLARGSVPAPG